MEERGDVRTVTNTKATGAHWLRCDCLSQAGLLLGTC